MTLDWDDIRHFVAAARSGSTLSASRLLGVSQTTVARRIDQLEQRIAARLFERHAGGYRLTATGAAALEAAESMAWDVAEFLGHFPRGQQPVSGTIRVVAEESLVRSLVLPAVDSMRLDLPQASWELQARDTPVEVADLGFDLGVHLSPPQLEPGVKLRALPAALPWNLFALDDAHGASDPWEGPDGGYRMYVAAPHEVDDASSWRDFSGLAALLGALRRGEGSGWLPQIVAESHPELLVRADGVTTPPRTDLWLTYAERKIPERIIDRLVLSMERLIRTKRHNTARAPLDRSRRARPQTAAERFASAA
jgi:DNA-binding transcriptional LysR family regulator